MSTAVAIAVDFVWLGMVLAISFLEAPLKFQAPGVTVRIGLGIGRRVFRALNIVEVVLAAVVLSSLLLGPTPVSVAVSVGIAIATLVSQLAVVRPRLNQRTSAVLAGEGAPGSHSHLVYIALEVVKVAGLVVGGVMLLAV